MLSRGFVRRSVFRRLQRQGLRRVHHRRSMHFPERVLHARQYRDVPTAPLSVIKH